MIKITQYEATAYQVRIKACEESIEYKNALEQLHTKLSDIARQVCALPLAGRVPYLKTVGGLSALVKTAIDKVSDSLVQDCGIFGKFNLVQQVLDSKKEQFREELQALIAKE